MKFLYNIALTIYYLAIKIASIKNNKAQKFIDGRKTIFKDLQQASNLNDNYVWFHCASLGEFEQARPVIKSLKINSQIIKSYLLFSLLQDMKFEKIILMLIIFATYQLITIIMQKNLSN